MQIPDDNEPSDTNENVRSHNNELDLDEPIQR